MIIDETPDVDGWARLAVFEHDRDDDFAVHLRIVHLGGDSYVMKIYIDEAPDFGADVLAAIGRTFSAWAVKSAELEVQL